MAGLLRTMNTADVRYSSKHASFGSWQALLADPEVEEYFHGWLARFYPPPYPQAASVRFGTPPEVFPGLRLRLLVEKDGQSYLLFVEDATDKSGLAYTSDERAIIRDCRFLP